MRTMLRWDFGDAPRATGRIALLQSCIDQMERGTDKLDRNQLSFRAVIDALKKANVEPKIRTNIIADLSTRLDASPSVQSLATELGEPYSSFMRTKKAYAAKKESK